MEACLNAFKVFTEAVLNLTSSLGIVIAGGWALWNYVIQRGAYAKIEFDLDLNILGRKSDKLLVEVEAIITNKGNVRQYLKDFSFKTLYLPGTDEKIEFGEDNILSQVRFKKCSEKSLLWFPPEKWEETFIDPNVSQRYSHVTAVPGDAAFILVVAEFLYPDRKSGFHTAQRVWAVNSIEQTRPLIKTR